MELKGFKQWLRVTFGSRGEKKDSEHIHTHPHRHGDYIHSHPHGHKPENHGHSEDEVPTTWLDQKFGHLKFYQYIRPVIIGVIHGFAGTAALTLMIIPLIESSWVALAYLLVFGVGTITGMMLVTAAIALSFVYTSDKSAIFNRANLRMVAGLFSLGFGLYLFYEIGFAGGLFF